MPVLITSDLHLSDQPKDEYRFGIFDWLAEQEHYVDYILILGDLTDRKDNHSAALVNKIVRKLRVLAKLVPIIILKGNHDYIDANKPFFKFLTHMKNITFITERSNLNIGLDDIGLFLPHTRNPIEDWSDIDIKGYKYIFMHQTVKGSLASNGFVMDGIDPDLVDNKWVFSGDIHVPQKIDSITYVGSPYQIKFGDEFEPRIILFDGDQIENLYFPCLRKHVVNISTAKELLEMNLCEGDQVKVRFNLSKEDYVDWANRKKKIVEVCEKLGVDLHSVEILTEDNGGGDKTVPPSDTPQQLGELSNVEIFEKFCDKEKLAKSVIKEGRTIL